MTSSPSALSLVFLLTSFVLRVAAAPTKSVFSCVGGSVQVAAHPDDDLLLMNPSLRGDFDNNLCITTLFLTSGDSGSGLAYAQSRETGNGAAYAYMAGVNDTWTEYYATFGGQPVLVKTLVAKPHVQRVFFRLPDGQLDGGGDAATGYQSLQRIYFGYIPSITSLDGKASFSLSTLKEAIGQIMTARNPDSVRTLDHLSDYDSGDHSDHYTAARLAHEVASSHAAGASFAGYMGYPVQNLPATMSTTDDDFIEKCNTFFTYTPYDYAECQSFSGCAGRGEYSWLQRQYVVTPALATSSNDGASDGPPTLPSGTNIAPLATTSASSFYSYGGINQPPSGAIDGIVGGYPGNDSSEWSSAGEGVGAWFKLQWSEQVEIGGIVIYDRLNSDDWLQAGTLTFDDGTKVSFNVEWNDGAANVIELPRNVTTSSILLTVTAVSSSTSNVGLAELQVFGSLCSSCSTPSASSTSVPATSVSTTLSASPSNPSPPTPPSGSPELALNATATASSWASVTSQGPEKAIDGVISGYTSDGNGDHTKEWASDHGGAGTWLTLTWPSAITANRIVLYDRPNLNDQITAATLTFSDGSSLAVPSLNNDGSATALDFAARTFDSLTLTVTAISSTTSSAGLAELQVYYVPAESSNTTTPVSTALPASSSSLSLASLASSVMQTFGTTVPPSSTVPSSTRSTVILSSQSTPAFSTPSSTSRSTSSAPSSTASLLNYAQTAEVGASSYASTTEQTPAKAVDGVSSGYLENGNGDYTKEWASQHEGVGAWFGLSWQDSILVNQIVLFDRPNLNDQILNASIRFSDNSYLYTGLLPNDGSALYLNFTAKTTDSLVLTVLKTHLSRILHCFHPRLLGRDAFFPDKQLVKDLNKRTVDIQFFQSFEHNLHKGNSGEDDDEQSLDDESDVEHCQDKLSLSSCDQVGAGLFLLFPLVPFLKRYVCM
ncbi:hypothetical protein JCM11641_001748 [Rhodosporidiobolus odoratus]